MSGDSESGSGVAKVVGAVVLGGLALFSALARHSDTVIRAVSRHGDDVGRSAVRHVDEMTPALRNTEDATRHFGGLPYQQAAEAEGRAVSGAADQAAAGVVETESETLLDKVADEVAAQAVEQAAGQALDATFGGSDDED